MKIDMTDFGEFVKTAIRPFLTLVGFGTWLAFIETGTEYPDAFQWIVITMILEWFGERAYKRFREMGGK